MNENLTPAQSRIVEAVRAATVPLTWNDFSRPEWRVITRLVDDGILARDAGRIVLAESVATVVSVDGGGGAKCADCNGSLTYSWRVLLSDGRNVNLCQMCLQKRPSAPAAEVAPEPEAPTGFVVSYANEDGETVQRAAANAADAIAIADDVTPHLPAWASGVSFYRAGDYDGDETITRETLQAAIREAKDAEVTARVAEEMLRGVTFDRNAASNRSADRLNYRHMVSAEKYGNVLVVLGNVARMGDYYAEAAMRATRKISLYLNDWQLVAGVAEAFAEFVREGWNDTRRATGPESGRPSDHQHATTMRQAITLSLVLVEVEHQLQLGYVAGVGWVVARLVREHDIRVNACYLPKVAEQLTASAAKVAEVAR
jgi:hypothetical protein